MKIYNSNHFLLDTFEDWYEGFKQVDQEKHWKIGRSAFELARFFTTPNNSTEGSLGEQYLRQLLYEISAEPVSFTSCIIEQEARFDHYRGRGRMHDMVVSGTIGNVDFFIGIEAKVDESFGNKILNEFNEKKVKPNSKAVDRIENLVHQFFGGDATPKQSDIANLRYQLLYYLAGSICSKAAIVLMPVLVFKSALYNEEYGENNKRDYIAFFEKVGFEKLNNSGELFHKELNGQHVYSCYHEIQCAQQKE